MQRNRAIDTIKGFAILLVMLGHCIVLNGLDKSDPYLYDAIKSVQMPLFMTVSGALAGISFAKRHYVFTVNTDFKAFRGEYLESLGRTIQKRAVSYLIPFFSWFVLSFVLAHALDGTMNLRLLCEEGVALLFQTDRGLWFLMTLFVITFAVMLSQGLADLILLEMMRRNIENDIERVCAEDGTVVGTEDCAEDGTVAGTGDCAEDGTVDGTQDDRGDTRKDMAHTKETMYVKENAYVKETAHVKETASFPAPGRFILCLCFIGVCYLLFFLQGRSGFLLLSPSLTVQYMPFYVLGYLIYGYAAGAVGKLPEKTGEMIAVMLKVFWWISAAGFLFLVWKYDLTKAPDGVSELLLQMAASFLGTYVCYYGVDRFVWEREKHVAAKAQDNGKKSGSGHGRKRGEGFLSFIGRYTLEIYVLHFRFARLLGISMMQLTFYSAQGMFWLLVCFALMSICTAYCIYTFKKWRLLDFLLFGKRKASASV